VDRGGRVLGVRQEEFGIALTPMTFTPDGEQLMTVRLPTGPLDFGQGEVVMWNWRDNDVVPIIDAAVRGAIPSPSGDLVATWQTTSTASQSDSVEIWDPATGQRVAVLEGNTGGVLGIAFNADGSRLATGGQDGTVRIWDPASGEQLLVLRGHFAGVFSVAFSPDGSRLASVGGEGVVREWTLELDELVDIAEHEVTRTLTDDECRQFLHQQRCE
jgi:WD40 repeat protein